MRFYSRRLFGNMIISPFINILRSILENSYNKDSIRWNGDGSGFYIWNHYLFSIEILPKYFRHNNIRSFTRQLNYCIYYFFLFFSLFSTYIFIDGFRKTSLVGDLFEEYRHDYFIRDKPEFLDLIKVIAIKYFYDRT